MKQLYIALLLHSILSIHSLQAQERHEADSLMSHIRHAMHFNRVVPQEKVYLHLDNMGYFENEQIWFKAYLTRTDTGRPSDLSKVLYVELLNMSGDVIKTTKWPVDSLGQSHGDMKLDSLLGSGYYEVRAYTRYMTNWGANACFSRVVPVFKKAEGGGRLQRPDHHDATVQTPRPQQPRPQQLAISQGYGGGSQWRRAGQDHQRAVLPRGRKDDHGQEVQGGSDGRGRQRPSL